jgi:hypothetical protein
METALRYQPHRGQLAIHTATERFRVVCTGRRFGKTLCLAGELLDRGALAPGDYGWIAPTYNVAERGKEALRDIAGGFVRFIGPLPSVFSLIPAEWMNRTIAWRWQSFERRL